MADSSVLVVTRLDDPTSDIVIAELNARGVPVVRMDPGEFTTGQAQLAARYGPGGLSGTAWTGTRELDLAAVRSVYYRRPSPYAVPDGMDEQDRIFALAQARHGFGGVLGSLTCRFVNHPWNIMQADHKPAALQVAAETGFQVPPTLVTNSLVHARAFAIEHGPVVYKPLRITPFRGQDGNAMTLWVDLVDPDELDERVELTAHVFQAATAGKVADVRIIAIGERTFGVRIDSPHLDFRRDYTKVSYSEFHVPRPLAAKCRAYLARFGLLFGAFDLGLAADRSLDFYECNSAGQWHWLEAETGLPMTAALADLLELT
jgi:ATP-grasp ribosomal peptide maturase